MAEMTENKMNNQGNKAASFWLAIVILVLLLIFSTVILSTQLYSFATIDERVLSIKSNAESHFNVFSLKYHNASGEVTVIGNDGEKVIAPGTEVEYTVRLRNADKVALDYELLPEAIFHSEYTIPVFVRVIGPDMTYIAGDATTWLHLEELNGTSARATLAKGESVEYIFQWKWPYENGDDEYDAFLGNKVHEETIGVTVSFDAYAAANTTLEDNDGAFGRVYGNTTFILIFVVLLLVAIILLLVHRFSRKKDESPEAYTYEKESI